MSCTCPSCPPNSHPHAPISSSLTHLADSPLPPSPSILKPYSYVGGGDFTQVDEQVNIFSPYTFCVTILEDRDVEDVETFSLSLTTDDMGVNIMTDTTVITITDASEYCHIGVDVVCGVMVAGGIQGVLVILMYVYTLGLDQHRLCVVMGANCCTVYDEVDWCGGHYHAILAI